jgi:hypothetical protein
MKNKRTAKAASKTKKAIDRVSSGSSAFSLSQEGPPDLPGGGRDRPDIRNIMSETCIRTKLERMHAELVEIYMATQIPGEDGETLLCRCHLAKTERRRLPPPIKKKTNRTVDKFFFPDLRNKLPQERDRQAAITQWHIILDPSDDQKDLLERLYVSYREQETLDNSFMAEVCLLEPFGLLMSMAC